MRANSYRAVGFPAWRRAGLLTGLAASAALLLAPVPASARPTDVARSLAIASGADTSVPVLNGSLVMNVEQHRRGGGGGGGGSRSGGGSSGGQAVPRGGSGGGSSSGGGSTATPSGPQTRSGSGASTGEGSSGTAQGSRPRDGRPQTGTAVERRPGERGGGTVIVGGPGYYGGFYPWGWGGIGLGYWGMYDGWGFYDPYYPSSAYGYADGSLKLKVKPRQAEVYVDGYFAGAVDDYDGAFQRLHLEPGPHRIEIRLDGYEPLSFEVRILPDRTVTYKGELRKVPRTN